MRACDTGERTRPRRRMPGAWPSSPPIAGSRRRVDSASQRRRGCSGGPWATAASGARSQRHASAGVRQLSAASVVRLQSSMRPQPDAREPGRLQQLAHARGAHRLRRTRSRPEGACSFHRSPGGSSCRTAGRRSTNPAAPTVGGSSAIRSTSARLGRTRQPEAHLRQGPALTAGDRDAGHRHRRTAGDRLHRLAHGHRQNARLVGRPARPARTGSDPRARLVAGPHRRARSGRTGGPGPDPWPTWAKTVRDRDCRPRRRRSPSRGD